MHIQALSHASILNDIVTVTVALAVYIDTGMPIDTGLCGMHLAHLRSPPFHNTEICASLAMIYVYCLHTLTSIHIYIYI